jgi:hypothetical protein
MKDMKKWSAENAPDKKMIKDVMQFASFMKDEANDVGAIALDLELPFDQCAILEDTIPYLKAQLDLPNLDVVDLDKAEGIPDRVVSNVAPGRPYLWMH